MKTIVLASFFLVACFAQRNVRIPPSIINDPPRNLIYRSGRNVTLHCKGTGVPAVTYDWTKNGLPLNRRSHNIREGPDGTITIEPATTTDEGFYQCYASNQYGTALSATAHVQFAFIADVLVSSEPLRQDVDSGKPFYIACNPFRSFPKATYSWEISNGTDDKYPEPFLPSAHTQIAENGDLHFGHGIGPDTDPKFYRCCTYNPFMFVQVGGRYTRVALKPSRRRRQAEIRGEGFASKSPTVAIVGGSVTLRCFFYLNRDSKISWVSPGYTFLIGRYVLDDFNTSLTMVNITKSDGGLYKCSTLEKNHTIRLIVEEAPFFSTVNDAPLNVNVSDGESYIFRCNPQAIPLPTIVWLQNGKVLDPTNPPERFSFSGDNRSLTIRDVCRDCISGDRKTDLMVIQCNASNVHGYAFAQGYLNVLNTFCEHEIDEQKSIQWNRTLAGREISQKCPGNTTGICSRKCLLNSDGFAFWSPPNYNGCFDKEFRDLLDNVSDVKTTSLKNEKIAEQLSVVTNRSEGLSAGNLNASIMIINRLAAMRSSSYIGQPNEDEIRSIVQATSNVLQPNNSRSWKELEAVNRTVATAVLLSADIYGRSLSTIEKSGYSIERADYLVLEAWSLKKSKLPLQLEFPSRSVWTESGGDKISISLEELETGVSSNLKMWGSYYRTVDGYLPGNKHIEAINSKVLSFSIDGLKTKEKLKHPVLITLQHNQEEAISYRRRCAYWNFYRSDWDSDGCSVTSTNSTHTICSCDHLTNFAILMSRAPSYDRALSIISIIGCSISVVALILTIIVYALTWKQSKSAQATVLINLCIVLIIAYIIFVTGADKVDSKVGCKTVAVLLHYFFLAAFFMMLAEGVELLLYIIFVFHHRRTIETVMLIVAAWVLPLIIVAVSLGSTKVEGYGNSNACWLSVNTGLIWAFIGPVLFIVTANFVILIIVLRWRSKQRAFMANNAKKRDEIRATLWNLAVACPVLGLGWLFGIISISSSHVVFQYLFVIINSLQGLLIFIFHALFHNKKVKEKISFFYSNYICCCRKSDHSVSAQTTSSQPQPTKGTNKAGFVPKAVKYYEQIAHQDNSTSAETKLTSIEDSEATETRPS